ncbi:MAG: DUF3859 domain-containing protein [Magnetococcales bacterium]|nr:DUF3859 domain-containing protein [Magnetococcales bacterium]
MLFRTLISVGFLFFICSGSALAGGVTSITIVDFGIYSGKVAPANTSDVSDQPKKELLYATLKRRTDGIPAKLKTEFGVEYVALGEDSSDVGTRATIDLKITHPPIKDPETGEVSSGGSWNKKIILGDRTYSGYGLDTPWELVPGIWTLEISYKGKLMATQRFILHRP